jgi:hypothetical protein
MAAQRGYTKYNPQGKNAYWLNCARQVLNEYRDNWPLTVRQIFYRLVASFEYPKLEKNYQALSQMIARARRAHPIGGSGAIPFEAIRDDTMRTENPFHFEDGENGYRRYMLQVAEQFRLNRQDDQERVIELWCEAGGMVPTMADIADPFGIKVSSGGGYDSVTSKHQLACRARDRFNDEGRGTLVLHVGDFDGSGEDMFNVLHEDCLTMFMQWGCPEHGFEVTRVALTENQVREYNVETAPPKPSDSRTEGFLNRYYGLANELGTDDISAQLEALTPPELTTLITAEIEEQMNTDVYNALLERESELREQIIEKVEKF